MPAKNLKRSLRRIRKKQQGGDGQGNQGHDVSMPIQYFGKELNRYYEANSPDLLPPSSAYGPTVATSHGVSIPGNDTAVGPDLGPFHKDIGHSGLQTGGGSKKSLRKNRKQKGGDGQGNQGHDVSMPIQYFGGKLDRYFPEGSPQLVAPDSAYGPTIATSHGVSIPGNSEFVGPDLGPFNAGLGISGLQTGGGKRKNKRKSIKKGGERLNLRAPNMDDGAPFHPQWGGNKKKQQKKKSSKQQKSQQQQKKLSQKKRQLQKLQQQVKELEKEIKQTGGDKLNLRCANMDCGPPFHPQWAGAMVTDEEQDGGAMLTDEEVQTGGADEQKLTPFEYIFNENALDGYSRPKVDYWKNKIKKESSSEFTFKVECYSDSALYNEERVLANLVKLFGKGELNRINCGLDSNMVKCRSEPAPYGSDDPVDLLIVDVEKPGLEQLKRLIEN